LTDRLLQKRAETHIVPVRIIAILFVFASTLLAQLATLEQRADAEFTAHDCKSAEKSYLEAVGAAEAAGQVNRTGLYYRRIGICRSRAGNITGALEVYQRGVAVTEASGDGELLEENVHGAALALQKLGRLDEAMAMGQREYELTQKCGHPEHLVRAMWLISELDDATGKSRAGLQLLEKALVINRTTNDRDGTLILLDNLALRYGEMGDYDNAVHVENEVLATQTAGSVGMAIAYNNMGEMLYRSGHPDEAWKWYEKSVAASTSPDAWRVHVGALLNVADMRNRAGRTPESDDAFRQALEIARSSKVADLESIGLRMQSDALLRRSESAPASEAATDALRIARQIQSPVRTYEALLALGAARSAAGQLVAAREYFDEGLGIVETLRAQTSGEASDLRGAFEYLIPLYQASVKNLIDLHLPAEALKRAEQAKARVLMDILLRGGVDERGAMTPAERAKEDELRKRMAAANGAVDDVMREFRLFRRGVYDNHPELAVQSADFEPASTEKLARLLPDSKTALLDYFLVPSGVPLFVVRGGAGKAEVSAYFLPDPKHSLAEEAMQFRQQLADREPGYRRAAQRLFARLLEPAMAGLRGTTNWIVSPDGALWDVPFEALVDNAGHHVIETRAVTVAPSLTAASEIHERRHAAATGGVRLLALGNPLPSAVPLPDAAREVAEIGANYPRGAATVLTGTAATAAALRAQAPSAGIIHLAAHAGLNNSDPLASFVRLGSSGKDGEDGMVTALDLMSLHLRADLVVLSACETALGSTGPGEGMIGMGWALSAAGASSSMLSLWKVDSAASRSFMTAFYRDYSANGTTRSAAVRQAGLEMLHSRCGATGRADRRCASAIAWLAAF
jgi:CHAT domain-containing protein/Tfp pilus assembly protein PilF